MNDLRNFGSAAATSEFIEERPTVALTFTGTGAEYFRIWVVNLTLTLCTFGAYGAWAKVRRTQYFYRNTQLAGVCFDYVAQPGGILMGRILALLLLSGYTFAYNYSPEAGGAVTAAVALLLPFLLWQAQRFRARNSLHRGLSFGFYVPLKDAYTAYLPPIVILFAPAVLAAFALGRAGGLLAPILTVIGFILLPLFHARFRRFVQIHTAYGQARFSFTANNGAFFRVWIKGVGVMVAASVGIGAAIGLCFFFVAGTLAASVWGVGFSVLLGAVGGYVGYLIVGSYYTARFQDLVWSATRIDQRLSFTSRVSVLTLLKLRAVNLLCIVCTLGLFRPFAVIRELRLRLQCVEVHGYPHARQVDAAAAQSRRGATGESAAELFDLDVGI